MGIWWCVNPVRHRAQMAHFKSDRAILTISWRQQENGGSPQGKHNSGPIPGVWPLTFSRPQPYARIDAGWEPECRVTISQPDPVRGASGNFRQSRGGNIKSGDKTFGKLGSPYAATSVRSRTTTVCCGQFFTSTHVVHTQRPTARIVARPDARYRPKLAALAAERPRTPANPRGGIKQTKHAAGQTG